VASSHEYDQSIYCTLRNDKNTFWSSGPSASSDANEFLIYELPSRQRVVSVLISSYNAS